MAKAEGGKRTSGHRDDKTTEPKDVATLKAQGRRSLSVRRLKANDFDLFFPVIDPECKCVVANNFNLQGSPGGIRFLVISLLKWGGCQAVEKSENTILVGAGRFGEAKNLIGN